MKKILFMNYGYSRDVCLGLTALVTKTLPQLLTEAGEDYGEVMRDESRHTIFQNRHAAPENVVLIDPLGQFEHDWRQTPINSKAVGESYHYINIHRVPQQAEVVRDVCQHRFGEVRDGVSFSRAGVGDDYSINLSAGNHIAYAHFAAWRARGITAVPIGVSAEDREHFLERYPARYVVKSCASKIFWQKFGGALKKAMQLIPNGASIGQYVKVKGTFALGLGIDAGDNSLNHWYSSDGRILTSSALLEQEDLPVSNLLILCQRLLLDSLFSTENGWQLVPEEIWCPYPDLLEKYLYNKREAAA